jgi:arsenite/tail-anchored protein-transporting ATPase
MRHLFDRQVLFFGGKGGVGKTTCASAAALAASRQGKRVLLVSTDPAHSTSDMFERPFGPIEREILPGLSGLEMDAGLEARRYVERVKEQIAKLFSPAILTSAAHQIELAATMPGAEDVALFDRMTELMVDRDGGYDLIVFDTAPTGHTLRLLRVPELLASWIAALSKARRAMLPPGEEAGPDPVLASLERRRDRIEEVRALLMRGRKTAFVLVLIPERLAIEEAARAVDALNDAGIAVGAAIVNRVLPEYLAGEFYESRRRQERVYLDEIERRFAHLRRVRVPQLESDVHGMGSLERISALLGC